MQGTRESVRARQAVHTSQARSRLPACMHEAACARFIQAPRRAHLDRGVRLEHVAAAAGGLHVCRVQAAPKEGGGRGRRVGGGAHRERPQRRQRGSRRWKRALPAHGSYGRTRACTLLHRAAEPAQVSRPAIPQPASRRALPPQGARAAPYRLGAGGALGHVGAAGGVPVHAELHLAQDHALGHQALEGLGRGHGADVVQHLLFMSGGRSGAAEAA